MDWKENLTRSDGGEITIDRGEKHSILRKQISQHTIRYELHMDIPYEALTRGFILLACDSE
jgi:hypothetical protein